MSFFSLPEKKIDLYKQTSTSRNKSKSAYLRWKPESLKAWKPESMASFIQLFCFAALSTFFWRDLSMGRESVSFDSDDDLLDDGQDNISAEEEEKEVKKGKAMDKRRLIEDRLEERRLEKDLYDDYDDFDLDDDS